MTEWILIVSIAVSFNTIKGWLKVELDDKVVYETKEACITAGKRYKDTLGYIKVQCISQYKPHHIYMPPALIQSEVVEVE